MNDNSMEKLEHEQPLSQPPSDKVAMVTRNKKMLAFLSVTFILLVVGVILIVLSATRHDCNDVVHVMYKTRVQADRCAYSDEAKRVQLPSFFEKLQLRYYQVFPEEVGMSPIGLPFKVYDPKPLAVRKVTDAAFKLLDEAKQLNPNLSLLKPREHMSYLRAMHFLENIFAKPSYNFYHGLWMLPPSSFCIEPICQFPFTFYNSVVRKPMSGADLENIVSALQQVNQSIYDYTDVLMMGRQRGMVRTQIECQAALDVLNIENMNVSKGGPEGIRQVWYTDRFYDDEFYGEVKNLNEKYMKAHGQNVSDYMQNQVLEYLGKSVHHLLTYMKENILWCRPDEEGPAGLSALPIKHIYYNGSIVGNVTEHFIPGCNEDRCHLNGSRAYEELLGHYTTQSDLSPDDIYQLGWDNLNQLFPQAVEVAKEVTGQVNESQAIEDFLVRIRDRKQSYFNREALPENETRGDAFLKCTDIDSAKIYCPNRWKAMQKWFEFAQMAMSVHDPNTVAMFHFTGEKNSVPNCPVQLEPDFNPSSGAQSYEGSDINCTYPTRYNIPFFLENLGPVFTEYSINAHEARPGHHTQVQGLKEHFQDECGGAEQWLGAETHYTSFAEGWALYAENPLIAQGTNVYDDLPMQKYGMLKWQIWRALRLIIDTGIHYKNMTRAEGLALFEEYAWDNTDISRKELTRYQSNFGQATSYMIGQLAIWQFRNRTEAALKNKFNLKDFHLQVLSTGNSPLAYLDSHLNTYVDCVNNPKKPNCHLVLHPTAEKGAGTPYARKAGVKYPPHKHYI